MRIARPLTAFSLDPSKRDVGKLDPEHLAFVRSLPCLICGATRMVEAAHVRYGDPTYGKAKTGLGQKPADRWSVPLCAAHHRTGPDAQHNSNEREWWERRGIDPLRAAVALKVVSGSYDSGVELVAAVRGLKRQESGS